MDQPGWHVVVTGPRAGDQRREALDFLAVALGHRPGTFEVTHRCPRCGSAEHGVPALEYSRLARRRRGPDAVDPDRVLPAVSFSRCRGWLATAWADEAATAAGWHVGVDLEDAAAPAFAEGEGMPGVGYSAEEEALVGALEEHERPGVRCLLWCAKEALVKARGTGFTADPADVAVTVPGRLRLAVPGAPGAVVVTDRDWPGGPAPEHLLGAVVLLPPA
ncbi:4-phosphopantetheinyl transferase family protein [Citricoccus sp. SGAir0253]|uniref:4'-phosphopantetheinyl transferase superfamily protein n=1 Tax=Citricoccus sp. SGAir0253 TaxID=2567881 RepID=UPI0010CCE5D7|nr:4'-phosphopantetheinyl transferase superfamily protein [Citricoccus sp. SGAir0253]QCU77772.1 4-phosphopantetheinyl transferase family protein [Citricoccus sp. SGAir0253]